MSWYSALRLILAGIMAVAVDNTGQSTGAASASTITISSFAVGAGPNRCIYLGVSQWKATDVQPTAVFNGSENFVVHDSIVYVEGTGNRRVTIFKLVGPSNVTANIVVSWSSAVDEAVCGATSWTGVDQATPFGAAVKNSNPSGPTATTSSISIPNAVGDAVHDTAAWDGPSGSAVGTANQTSRWKNTGGANTSEGDGQSATGTGSNITCTWSTETNGFFAHIGVAIRQSVSGVADASAQQARVAKPLTLLRCRPLGPGNPLREVKIYEVPAAAALGVTLAPDVGSLVFDGFAPTIETPVTVAPALGQLTLTGFAPAVGTPVTLRPGLGQLTLTGFAPSIGLPVTLRPGLGQLLLIGFAPTIVTPVTLTPGVGVLTLAGFAPVIGTPVTLRPGVGQLILTGFAPSITVTVAGVTLQPGVGQLVLTGFGPTIGTPVTLRPGVGALTLSGHAPVIGLPVTVRPGVGQLVFDGYAPSITLVILGGTTAFSGELSAAPRFSGNLEAAPQFSGIIQTSARFAGRISITERFSGIVLVTPFFDGDLELEPA